MAPCFVIINHYTSVFDIVVVYRAGAIKQNIILRKYHFTMCLRVVKSS